MIKILTSLIVLLLGTAISYTIPSYALEQIYISEIYFQRTDLSSRDKWIELYNPTSTPIDLRGYALSIGKSGYIFDLAKSNPSRTIPSQAYYIIQDNWGDEAHFLEQAGVLINDFSGRAHWISNVTSDPHITLKLLYEGEVIQNIHYNTAQTSNLLASSPKTSLECTISACSPSQNQFGRYIMSPRGQTLPRPVIKSEPKNPEPAPIIKPIIAPRNPRPKPEVISQPVKSPQTYPVTKPVLAPQPATVPETTIDIITNTTPIIEETAKTIIDAMDKPNAITTPALSNTTQIESVVENLKTSEPTTKNIYDNPISLPYVDQPSFSQTIINSRNPINIVPNIDKAFANDSSYSSKQIKANLEYNSTDMELNAVLISILYGVYNFRMKGVARKLYNYKSLTKHMSQYIFKKII